jgi:spermidine synthase
MRFLPLVPVAVLFGPPTYLLGFVSPYAAELSEKEGTGAASGHVYALGTVGSIIGAFGTTFLLVPALRVEHVALLFGALLLLAALSVSSGTPAQLAGVATAGVVLVATVGVGIYGVPGQDVVYRTQTPYQELEVVDDGNVRTLYLDGHPHSAMDKDDPYRHVFEYTRYFHLPLLMNDDVDRVLFVGGGGFTGPKIFEEKYDVEIDVVELDPEVIRVAREYFRVEESDELDVNQGAGRRFLANATGNYDLIVLDAYRKAQVPFQLTTVEFMELARQHLTPDGVVLANVISAPEGPASKFARAQFKTMERVFPQVYAFPTEESTSVQNVILVASRRSERLTQAELRRRNRQRDIGVNLSDAVAHYRASLDTSGMPVLRDDHAPVGRLLESNVGREYSVERTNETTTPRPAVRGAGDTVLVGRAAASSQ